MKKAAFIIFMALLSLTMNAQIFTEKRVYDKFDDVIESKTIKTLVSQDIEDGTIIIEEKGSNPQVYKVLNWCDYASQGDKDNIVNLINDVYGYEDTWCVIKEEDLEAYTAITLALIGEELSQDEAIKQMEKYWLFITHRVITTQYTQTYQTEYWWVKNENTGVRQIYLK